MSEEQLRLDLGMLPHARTPEPPRKPPPPRSAPAPQPAREAVRPFHYTDAMWEVVRDVVATLPDLAYIDLDRVLLSIAQARQASRHGVYASCFPMRFAGGERETREGERRYRMPELHHEGREILYVIYFMLPRFHAEQDYHAKIATVIHELYHISPQFNGDIRRFPGKNFAHGHSRSVYHAAMCRLADRYLGESPRARDHAFLDMSFPTLLARPGGVVGLAVSRPRPVLLREKK